jgi:hypothetical protein
VLASLALIILYHAIIYISVFGNWEAHLIADDYQYLTLWKRRYGLHCSVGN